MKPLFYLVVFSSALVHAQQCRIGGQVFFSDVVDHTVTIKTDSGDLVNFNYDSATIFLRAAPESQQNAGANRVLPEALNNGDRLCVGASKPAVVTVTPRQEIDSQQKRELAAWQADSLYGVVSGLERQTRQLTLAVSVGDKTTSYSVDVSPAAAFWVFPANTVSMRDAVAGSLDRVALGDTLYIRGAKNGSNRFVASLVVSGGLRSFAATIESMETLDEQMHVRLVLSGQRRTVHVNLGALYAIVRAEGTSADTARRLYPISAGDVQPGDTVLILGIGEGADSLRACALITGFSPFGSLPPDPNQQMRWIFDNVSLGVLY